MRGVRVATVSDASLIAAAYSDEAVRPGSVRWGYMDAPRAIHFGSLEQSGRGASM